MSEYVLVRRELLECVVKTCAFTLPEIPYQELRAVLAQEAGHVEEPLGMVDAILLEDCVEHFMRDYGKGYFSTPDCVKKVFTSPPAPVAVVLPTREAMRDLIAEVVGGDTYDCTRVWSAWGVGTMSEDDFVPLVEQEERLYELADACLDKVKELNQ